MGISKKRKQTPPFNSSVPETSINTNVTKTPVTENIGTRKRCSVLKDSSLDVSCVRRSRRSVSNPIDSVRNSALSSPVKKKSTGRISSTIKESNQSGCCKKGSCKCKNKKQCQSASKAKPLAGVYKKAKILDPLKNKKSKPNKKNNYPSDITSTQCNFENDADSFHLIQLNEEDQSNACKNNNYSLEKICASTEICIEGNRTKNSCDSHLDKSPSQFCKVESCESSETVSKNKDCFTTIHSPLRSTRRSSTSKIFKDASVNDRTCLLKDKPIMEPKDTAAIHVKTSGKSLNRSLDQQPSLKTPVGSSHHSARRKKLLDSQRRLLEQIQLVQQQLLLEDLNYTPNRDFDESDDEATCSDDIIIENDVPNVIIISDDDDDNNDLVSEKSILTKNSYNEANYNFKVKSEPCESPLKGNSKSEANQNLVCELSKSPVSTSDYGKQEKNYFNYPTLNKSQALCSTKTAEEGEVTETYSDPFTITLTGGKDVENSLSNTSNHIVKDPGASNLIKLLDDLIVESGLSNVSALNNGKNSSGSNNPSALSKFKEAEVMTSDFSCGNTEESNSKTDNSVCKEDADRTKFNSKRLSVNKIKNKDLPFKDFQEQNNSIEVGVETIGKISKNISDRNTLKIIQGIKKEACSACKKKRSTRNSLKVECPHDKLYQTKEKDGKSQFLFTDNFDDITNKIKKEVEDDGYNNIVPEKQQGTKNNVQIPKSTVVDNKKENTKLSSKSDRKGLRSNREKLMSKSSILEDDNKTITESSKNLIRISNEDKEVIENRETSHAKNVTSIKLSSPTPTKCLESEYVCMNEKTVCRKLDFHEEVNKEAKNKVCEMSSEKNIEGNNDVIGKKLIVSKNLITKDKLCSETKSDVKMFKDHNTLDLGNDRLDLGTEKLCNNGSTEVSAKAHNNQYPTAIPNKKEHQLKINDSDLVNNDLNDYSERKLLDKDSHSIDSRKKLNSPVLLAENTLKTTNIIENNKKEIVNSVINADECKEGFKISAKCSESNILVFSSNPDKLLVTDYKTSINNDEFHSKIDTDAIFHKVCSDNNVIKSSPATATNLIKEVDSKSDVNEKKLDKDDLKICKSDWAIKKNKTKCSKIKHVEKKILNEKKDSETDLKDESSKSSSKDVMASLNVKLGREMFSHSKDAKLKIFHQSDVIKEHSSKSSPDRDQSHSKELGGNKSEKKEIPSRRNSKEHLSGDGKKENASKSRNQALNTKVRTKSESIDSLKKKNIIYAPSLLACSPRQKSKSESIIKDINSDQVSNLKETKCLYKSEDLRKRSLSLDEGDKKAKKIIVEMPENKLNTNKKDSDISLTSKVKKQCSGKKNGESDKKTTRIDSFTIPEKKSSEKGKKDKKMENENEISKGKSGSLMPKSFKDINTLNKYMNCVIKIEKIQIPKSIKNTEVKEKDFIEQDDIHPKKEQKKPFDRTVHFNSNQSHDDVFGKRQRIVYSPEKKAGSAEKIETPINKKRRISEENKKSVTSMESEQKTKLSPNQMHNEQFASLSLPSVGSKSVLNESLNEKLPSSEQRSSPIIAKSDVNSNTVKINNLISDCNFDKTLSSNDKIEKKPLSESSQLESDTSQIKCTMDDRGSSIVVQAQNTKSNAQTEKVNFETNPTNIISPAYPTKSEPICSNTSNSSSEIPAIKSPIVLEKTCLDKNVLIKKSFDSVSKIFDPLKASSNEFSLPVGSLGKANVVYQKIGFIKLDTYIEGIKMYKYSRSLWRTTEKLPEKRAESIVDKDDQMTVDEDTYSLKTIEPHKDELMECTTILNDACKEGNFTDVEKFFLPYCPELLKHNKCLMKDCSFEHNQFDRSIMMKVDFSEAWCHVEKLFNKLDGYILSPEVFEGIADWLGSQGKRNKMLEPCHYLASLPVETDSRYLSKCWTALIRAYIQTGVNMFHAIQNILQQLVSHSPAYSVQVLQNVIVYSGLMEYSIEEVWPVIQVLKNVPGFFFPVKFFEIMMMSALIKNKKTITNDFKKILEEFANEFLKMDKASLINMDFVIVDYFTDCLYDCKLYLHESKVKTFLKSLNDESNKRNNAVSPRNLHLVSSPSLKKISQSTSEHLPVQQETSSKLLVSNPNSNENGLESINTSGTFDLVENKDGLVEKALNSVNSHRVTDLNAGSFTIKKSISSNSNTEFGDTPHTESFSKQSELSRENSIESDSTFSSQSMEVTICPITSRIPLIRSNDFDKLNYHSDSSISSEASTKFTQSDGIKNTSLIGSSSNEDNLHSSSKPTKKFKKTFRGSMKSENSHTRRLNNKFIEPWEPVRFEPWDLNVQQYNYTQAYLNSYQSIFSNITNPIPQTQMPLNSVAINPSLIERQSPILNGDFAEPFPHGRPQNFSYESESQQFFSGIDHARSNSTKMNERFGSKQYKNSKDDYGSVKSPRSKTIMAKNNVNQEASSSPSCQESYENSDSPSDISLKDENVNQIKHRENNYDNPLGKSNDLPKNTAQQKAIIPPYHEDLPKQSPSKEHLSLPSNSSKLDSVNNYYSDETNSTDLDEELSKVKYYKKVKQEAPDCSMAPDNSQHFFYHKKSKILSLPFPRGTVESSSDGVNNMNLNTFPSTSNISSPSSSISINKLNTSQQPAPFKKSSLSSSQEDSKTSSNIVKSRNVNITPEKFQEIRQSMVHLLREKRFREIFSAACDWAENRQVMENLAFSILDALKSVDKTLIYLILRDFFQILYQYQLTTTERNINLYSLFGTVATSVMVESIRQEFWKNANDIYSLLLTLGFSETINERFSFGEEDLSQVCIAIAICEVLMHSKRYSEAVKIILENKLLLEKEQWVLVGKEDDTDIVWQFSAVLLETMCENGADNELIYNFQQEVIQSQKSLRNPINVVPAVEFLLAAFHEYNPTKKVERQWLKEFYQFLKSFDNLEGLSDVSLRILVINFVRFPYQPGVDYLYPLCIHRNIYSELSAKNGFLTIKSCWQKEEMWLVLNKWFETIARYVKSGAPFEKTEFIIQYQLMNPPKIEIKKKPSRLLHIDQSIEKVHIRLNQALGFCNPPLIYESINLEKGTVKLHTVQCQQIISRKLGAL